MKLLALLLLSLLSLPGVTRAQMEAPEPFAVSRIPDSLRRNANQVIVLSSQEVRITDSERMETRVHQVITLLDDRAKSSLFFTVFYDQFIHVGGIHISVYDSTGALVRQYHKRDLLDESLLENETIDDYRAFMIRIGGLPYPFTLEETYDYSASEWISYPEWNLVGPGESLVSSTYSLQLPPGQRFHYKGRGIALRPAITMSGLDSVFTWSARGIGAVREESQSMAPDYNLPELLLAPDQFDYGDHPGRMDSWNAYGSWAYGLFTQNENALPGGRRSQILDLVARDSTTAQKVGTLYSYLQANMRYVSIQLGIGGFKPFPASFVDEKKYGDCKALSNYMRELLSIAGIPSFIALINAGENQPSVDPEFPEQVFNHAILCVPLGRDSIWLDCTNHVGKAGVLGSFTENRYALLLTPEGGKLVRTPSSRCSENQLHTLNLVSLDPDGSGKSETRVQATGDFSPALIYLLQDDEKDNQVHFITSQLKYRKPDDFTLDTALNQEGDIQLRFSLGFQTLPDLAAGSELFLLAHLHGTLPDWPAPDTARTQDYFLHFPFENSDTTIYHLPEGYAVARLPATQHFIFPCGNFTSSYRYDPQKHEVTSTESLVITQNRIPARQYGMFTRFMDQVEKDFRQRIEVTSPQ